MTLQQQIHVTGSVFQVQFTLTDTDYPFVGVSAIDGCRVFLEEIIPRGGGVYAEFYSVSGVDPSEVMAAARGYDSVQPNLLNEYENGGLFEFEVSGKCPVLFLGELGALPRCVYSVGGRGHISAEIPSSENASEVVAAFLDAHPDAELVGKREQPYITPMFGHRRFREAMTDRLTDRQEEILSAADEAGYYDWPRKITAERLADQLGISTSTLLKHLRTAERKLVGAFFEEPSVIPDDRSGQTAVS